MRQKSWVVAWLRFVASLASVSPVPPQVQNAHGEQSTPLPAATDCSG